MTILSLPSTQEPLPHAAPPLADNDTDMRSRPRGAKSQSFRKRTRSVHGCWSAHEHTNTIRGSAVSRSIILLDGRAHLASFLLRICCRSGVCISHTSSYRRTSATITLKRVPSRLLPLTEAFSSRSSTELPSASVFFELFPEKAPDNAPKMFKFRPAWKESWNEFKNNSRVMQGLFNMKNTYEESENPLISTARSIGDRVAGFFAENETARVIKKFREIDPNFQLEPFLRDMREYMLPEVLDAYVKGDVEVLKMWLSAGLFRPSPLAQHFS